MGHTLKYNRTTPKSHTVSSKPTKLTTMYFLGSNGPGFRIFFGWWDDWSGRNAYFTFSAIKSTCVAATGDDSSQLLPQGEVHSVHTTTVPTVTVVPSEN